MSWGLWIFVIVHVLNLIGLLVDYVLYSEGLPTITYHVYYNPLWGAPILFIQVLAFIGLVAHFYGDC